MGLHMGCQWWFTCGFPMGVTWGVPGIPWATIWVSMGCLWGSHGVTWGSIGFPWFHVGHHVASIGVIVGDVVHWYFSLGFHGANGVHMEYLLYFMQYFLGAAAPQTTSFHDYICLYITQTQIHMTKNNNNKIVKPNNTKK